MQKASLVTTPNDGTELMTRGEGGKGKRADGEEAYAVAEIEGAALTREAQGEEVEDSHRGAELAERYVEEMERHNHIQLLSSGPSGTESAMAKEFFELRQKERLAALKESLQKETATESLEALADMSGEAEDAPWVRYCGIRRKVANLQSKSSGDT